MKFDPKIDLYLEAATGASETPSHRGKSRFPLAGVSLGAQYRPPLGQSLQCWRPNPGFDIVKQANLHYQPKYSTCRSSSAGCPPEPRLALACRPEDSVLYISRKALISSDESRTGVLLDLSWLFFTKIDRRKWVSSFLELLSPNLQ